MKIILQEENAQRLSSVVSLGITMYIHTEPSCTQCNVQFNWLFHMDALENQAHYQDDERFDHPQMLTRAPL